MIVDDILLAEVGYLAYGGSAGWKNYRDDPMPQWRDLPDKQRTAWEAAASEIVAADRSGRPLVRIYRLPFGWRLSR